MSETLSSNIARCDMPYELLVCDQGSKDPRVKAFLKLHDIKYFRENSCNEGISKSYNQLYLRSSGEYILILNNDLLMPPKWASLYTSWLDKVPRAGLAGTQWETWIMPPISSKFGLEAHWITSDKSEVYGAVMLKRNVIETVGLFPESFDIYGEDFDLNKRVTRAGFNSFYIPGVKTSHLGEEPQDSEYWKIKNKSLQINREKFYDRIIAWDRGAPLKEPLPEMRDPL